MAKKKAAAKAATKSRRLKYKKNYLKQVIVRLDFTSPILATHSPIAEAIHDAVKKQFPNSEQRKHVNKQLQFGMNGISSSSNESSKWLFKSRTGDKALLIENTAITITYSNYETFEVLRDDFVRACNALVTQIPSVKVSRLGLRYINNIEMKEKSPTRWDKYLSPNLLGIFNIASDPQTISRAFHMLEFNYGEKKMRFQFGMPNPDYPAQIKKKLFVLDYDIYRDGTIDNADIEKMLVEFHDKVNASFEEVITSTLRKRMGVVRG